MQCRNMLTDDAENGQEGDHDKHSWESPYHAPGNDTQDDHEGIDLYIIPYNIWSKYVILSELYNQENQ